MDIGLFPSKYYKRRVDTIKKTILHSVETNKVQENTKKWAEEKHGYLQTKLDVVHHVGNDPDGGQSMWRCTNNAGFYWKPL